MRKLNILVILNLVTLVSFSQKTAEDFYNAAGKAVRTHEFDLAFEYLDKAIAQDSNYAAAYSFKGYLKWAIGDYKDAIAAYDKGLNIDSIHPRALYHRGLSKQCLKKYRDAIEDYDRALAIESDHFDFADVYNARSYLRFILNDFTGSKEDFEKAFELKKK